MNMQEKHRLILEKDISAALLKSAQLAREEAIRHGTGIVVQMDGEVVEISAKELKKQAQKKKNEAQV